MTKREIVSRLRGDLIEHFDDSKLFNRHLWNAFWTASKVLIQREQDSNKLKRAINFKSFNLDTEDVDKFEDTCVPITCIACRVKLPKLVSSKTGVVYSFLGSPDLSISYAIVSPSEFVVKSKIKGTKSGFAYVDNGYLYLSKCLPCLKFLALPDDDGSDGAGCGVLDEDSGLTDYLIEGALRMAKENVAQALGKPYDHAANKTESN